MTCSTCKFTLPDSLNPRTPTLRSSGLPLKPSEELEESCSMPTETDSAMNLVEETMLPEKCGKTKDLSDSFLTEKPAMKSYGIANIICIEDL